MDSAYDADLIWGFSRQLGHIPIINLMPQRKTCCQWTRCRATLQATDIRRTSQQPAEGALRARWVRVRGAQKSWLTDVWRHRTNCIGVIARLC